MLGNQLDSYKHLLQQLMPQPDCVQTSFTQKNRNKYYIIDHKLITANFVTVDSTLQIIY